MKLTTKESALLKSICELYADNDNSSVDSSFLGTTASIRGTLGSLVAKGLVTTTVMNGGGNDKYHLIDVTSAGLDLYR